MNSNTNLVTKTNYEEIPYWLGLNSVPNLGPNKFFSILNHFQSAKYIWSAKIEEIKDSGILTDYLIKEFIKIRDSNFIEDEWERIKKNGIKILTYNDPDYPQSLKKIFAPPPVLYVKGNLKGENKNLISIVGSRKCSNYGKTIAEEISFKLAKEGLTIVSGMAYGIDTAAHKGALNANGRTIAVLGSGINVIYPASNRKLFEEISNKGAIITEFPFNIKPEKRNFPIRNRIIAALSFGTLIVEASPNSGSLITTSLALEYGKEVFAIPGDINSILSKGPHQLIKSGAKLVETAEDILEEIGYRKKVELELPVNLDEKSKIIYDLIKFGPMNINEIIVKTKLNPGEIAGILLELELQGYIKQLPGNIYIIKS